MNTSNFTPTMNKFNAEYIREKTYILNVSRL